MSSTINVSDINGSVTLGVMWCVGCLPQKIYATFVYRGDSLCDECFKAVPKDYEWRKTNETEV